MILIFNVLMFEGCPKPQWVGDGYCDDITNNEACTFDGGDCCGSTVNTEYCTECICLLNETCIAGTHPWVGDRHCNDETNHVECYYDGGDCCGSCVNIDQCSDCVCHTEGALSPDNSCK